MKNGKRSQRNDFQGLNRPNILIVGYTGAGKTSLLQQVFGKGMVSGDRIGHGAPTTTDFTVYESDEIRIYDSQGLEPGKDGEEVFTSRVEKFVGALKNKSSVPEQVHMLWYCINGGGGRVTPCDLRLIHRLAKHVIVVITKSDITRPDQYKSIAEVLQKNGIAPANILPCSTLKAPQLKALCKRTIELAPEAYKTAIRESMQLIPLACTPDSFESLFNLFGLNHSETELYFSLHRILTEKDIDETDDEKICKKKRFWLGKYLDLIRLNKSVDGMPLNCSLSRLEISERLRAIPISKGEILLFEARIFTPYFTLNIKHELLDGLKNGYQSKSVSSTRILLDKLATAHKLDPKRIQACEVAYGDTIKQIRGDLGGIAKAAITVFAAIVVAVTAGYAAPAIGAYVGGLLGFWGCAATSAGLAFLGGGALAAGGFGMAGGVIAIIGGGFILGGTGGAAILAVIDQDSPFVLQNIAKLEAIVKVLLLEQKGLSDLVEKITKSYEKSIQRIKDTIAKETGRVSGTQPDEDKKINKTRLKELNLSLSYYEQGIKRLHAGLL